MTDLEQRANRISSSGAKDEECSSSPSAKLELQNCIITHDEVKRRYFSGSIGRSNFLGLGVLLLVCVICAIGASFLPSSSRWSPSSNNNNLQEVTVEPLRDIIIKSSSTATTTPRKNNNRLLKQDLNNNRHLFLLSGQSNMDGHTTSKLSIGENGDYWNTIKSILQQGGNEQQLYNVIRTVNDLKDGNGISYLKPDELHQLATTLTNGVMELYKSSLLNDLDSPLQFGKCSYKAAFDSLVEDVSQGTVPTVWNANCGLSFGHELLFSRTLELAMNYTTPFEMHKVSRGGSALYQHWYPNHGQHWELLKGAIEERRGEGEWKGFIWHQGSQAAWSLKQYGEDRSLTYHGNLTGLVSEVRELMFQNSVSWKCKEEIPVVIVQVGFWPSRNALAQRTRDAQAKFCTDDPRAVLVKTDDLSRFYHYDAPSFLISGNRIAHAYQEAMEGVVECPDRVPSSSPSMVASSSPSEVPSSSPSEAPSKSPSSSPSEILTSYVPTLQAGTDSPVVSSTSTSYVPTTLQIRTDFPVASSTNSQSIVCQESNAKFFKLTLNSESSPNTSWTLYDSADTIFYSRSSLDLGAEYSERICVIPDSYRFEISSIGEGCYEGFLRGVMIFESCGDGVHEFTLELNK